MPTFRIHLAGGDKLDVIAKTADEARKQAQSKGCGLVVKIKIVREGRANA